MGHPIFRQSHLLSSKKTADAGQNTACLVVSISTSLQDIPLMASYGHWTRAVLPSSSSWTRCKVQSGDVTHDSNGLWGIWLYHVKKRGHQFGVSHKLAMNPTKCWCGTMLGWHYHKFLEYIYIYIINWLVLLGVFLLSKVKKTTMFSLGSNPMVPKPC